MFIRLNGSRDRGRRPENVDVLYADEAVPDRPDGALNVMLLQSIERGYTIDMHRPVCSQRRMQATEATHRILLLSRILQENLNDSHHLIPATCRVESNRNHIGTLTPTLPEDRMSHLTHLKCVFR